MKLIIDINEKVLEHIKTQDISLSEIDVVCESIANGTPISTEGDLISRSALKEKIDFVFPYDPLADYEENIGEVMKLIDNAPTTKVSGLPKVHYDRGFIAGYEKAIAERPQGEWIRLSDRLYKCKNCGYIADFKYPFCHCGSDMRKGGAE